MMAAGRLSMLLVTLMLAGCATSPQTGIIAARWTPPHQATVPVTLSWESSDDTHGHIFATLGAGGEHFHGQYVRVTQQTEVDAIAPIVGGWGPIWSGYAWGPGVDPWYWGAPGVPGAYGSAYYSGFVTAYTGKVVATLFGNHGHSMRCRFTLNEPYEGLIGGGVGECQTSDGAEIDAEF